MIWADIGDKWNRKQGSGYPKWGRGGGPAGGRWDKQKMKMATSNQIRANNISTYINRATGYPLGQAVSSRRNCTKVLRPASPMDTAMKITPKPQQLNSVICELMAVPGEYRAINCQQTQHIMGKRDIHVIYVIPSLSTENIFDKITCSDRQSS